MKSAKSIKSPSSKGNKEQFRRWLYLDQYLSNPIGYSVKELLELLNEKLEQDSIRKRNGELKKVSLRTLYDDLNSIQDIFADRIAIENNKGIFRYEDTRMSIFQTGISQEEYHRLRYILSQSKRNITSAIYEETESLIDRLFNPLNLKIHDKKDYQSFIISSSQSSLEKKWLNSLIEIIDSKGSIQITYRKSTQEIKQYNLTPLGLKENLGIWYVVAYDHGDKIKNPEKTYRIARIISLIKTELERPEEINSFNLEDYFRFSTGIHQEGNKKPEDVILEVSDKKIIDELKEHPLNETQRLKSEIAGNATFVAKCYISYELVNQIFSLGSDVKIIQPKSLIQKLVKKTSEHLAHYTS
jgi:predicted DNA-binding transcriptional regulator YafY